MPCNFACKPCGRSPRAARVEFCHWSEGRHNNVWVSLRESRATMQVILVMSLRERWDATLVLLTKLTPDTGLPREERRSGEAGAPILRGDVEAKVRASKMRKSPGDYNWQSSEDVKESGKEIVKMCSLRLYGSASGQPKT